MRVFAIVAALLMLGGPAAWADAPITTANPAQASDPQPSAPQPPLPPDAAALQPGQQVAMGPCGPEKVKPNGHLDTAAHGEVEAGVGTGGYRHLGGTVCQPLGDNGAVAVSISQTQGPTWGVRR